MGFAAVWVGVRVGVRVGVEVLRMRVRGCLEVGVRVT